MADTYIHFVCVIIIHLHTGTESSWLLADMFRDQSGFPFGKRCAVLLIC